MATTSDSKALAQSPEPPRRYLYGVRRYGATMGLALSLFVSLLDTTIVAVTLPKIGDELQGYDRSSWVVTAYLVTYVAFLPIFSKLAEISGPKYVLLVASSIFVAFSGACGAATTMTELIVFRALQGIGGSALWSCSIVAFYTMFPPEVSPKYLVTIGITYATASCCGPILGGVISQHLNWSWIFWINLPLGAISICVMLLSMHGPGVGSLSWRNIRRNVDWLGALLILTSLLLLSLALQLGGGPQFTWSDGPVLGTLITSVVLLPALVWVELRSDHPIMPIDLFRRHRNIPLFLVTTIGTGAGFFATVVYLPQRMQLVDGLSAQAAGIRTLPMLVTAGVSGALAPPIVYKTRSYRAYLLISIALCSIIGGLISRLGAPTNFAALYPFEVLMGAASGAILGGTTLAFPLAVLEKDIPVALGFLSTARMLGALLGISTASTILNSFVKHRLRTSSLDPAVVDAVMKAPDIVIPTLPAEATALVRESYAQGYKWIFISIAVWFSAAALVSLFIRHLPVPSKTDTAETHSSGSVHALDDLPTLDGEASKHKSLEFAE